MQIKYGDKEVNLGNELTPTETKHIPEVHYKHEGGVLYTLVMSGTNLLVKILKRSNRKFANYQ